MYFHTPDPFSPYVAHPFCHHISANIFAVFFKLVRLLLRAALSVSVSVAQAAQSAGAWASARASLARQSWMPCRGSGRPRLAPRCRQCNTALGLEPRSPAEGRHWARECRPKAVTGLHWARECRPKAVTGHGSAGRRPSLACTGHGSARPKANTPVPVRHCLHPGIKSCGFSHHRS